jgi:GNAT superfamily N-acetyltransferase
MIQIENLQDCKEEIFILGKEHFKEIDILGYAYDPNVVMYDLLDESNALLVLTLRIDGVLKGYSVTAFSFNTLHKDVLNSQCILLYVAKDIRGSGLKLMRKTEEAAEAKGSELHVWDVPARNDFSVILERQGYAKIETMYGKRLGGR